MARDGDTASVPRSVPVPIIDHVTLSAAKVGSLRVGRRDGADCVF